MEIKFDKTDRKLISYLYHNYREPLTKIAKSCGISRDQVEYRLKKYEQQGLIKKYATIFNYELLGYDEFIVVWIKSRDSSKRDFIKNELKENKNVFTYFDVLGDYDLGFDLIYKNKQEFQKEFNKFIRKHEKNIQRYSIMTTISSMFFPLKEFGLNYQEKKFSLESSEKTRKKLDKTDWKIIEALEKNGREKIINIASKANISGELASYKINQLYKNRIILGTRIVFDLEKIGYFFGNMRLNIILDEKTKKEISEFCKQHKYINALSFGVGEFNCIVQFLFKEEKNFRDSIKEFLNRFNNKIFSSEILLIENEGEIKTLPL